MTNETAATFKPQTKALYDDRLGTISQVTILGETRTRQSDFHYLGFADRHLILCKFDDDYARLFLDAKHLIAV